MTEAWERTGIIASGGSVLDVIGDDAGHAWMATAAGVFRLDGGVWRPSVEGMPLSQVNALTRAGRYLIVGGVGQIAYSTDEGRTWYQSRVRRGTSPITRLLPSPAFQRDRLVLAATDGDGVLRSTDSGLNWRPSNLGLRDLSVLDIKTAPRWGRREVVFAATTRGVYRSSNAGQAWKQSSAGLGDAVVQCLAVSPDFAADATVFAGTEVQGIFRSTDGGATWHTWGEGPAVGTEGSPINCLWVHPQFSVNRIMLAGTGEGDILRSQDGGAQWARVSSEGAPVLCLAGVGRRIYAGLHEQGMLYSDDDGVTWAEVEGLAVRAITRLVAGYGGRLFAFGPWEGVWRSTDGGETWDQLSGLEEVFPIRALAASPQAARPCLLAAGADRLLQSEDEGATWRGVLREKEIMAIVFSPRFTEDGCAWVGTETGELLSSSDGGHTWTSLSAPQPGVPLVALAVHSSPGDAVGLAVASYESGRRRVTVWYSGDGGETWEQWLRHTTNWPAVHLSLAGPGAEGAILCIDREGWHFTPRGWQRVLKMESPIVRLLRVPGQAGGIVATSRQVFRSDDGVNWSYTGTGLPDQTLMDLVLLSSDDLGERMCALGMGGAVWHRR